MPDQPNDLTRKVFRAEIAAVNAHLAETGPSVPADADLRYQVLHALDFAYCNGIGYETPEQLLDAYDAHRPVLPAPADRAAIYRSLADHYDRIAGAAFPGDKTDWYEAIADVAAGLHRMADEAQQAGEGGALKRAHVALAEQAGRDQAALARVRALHDNLAASSELTSPDDSITRGAAARRIAAALDGRTEAQTCGAWGGCTLPAGHNMGHADIPENHSTGKAQQEADRA